MALSPWPTTPAALAAATASLRAALNLKPGVDDEPVQRVGAVAAALVERYAPAAPQAVKDEAVIRAAGWLADQPPAVAKETVGPMSVEYMPARQSALRHSGAMAMLSPWKVRRAGAIG